ncbi:hypothetical protein ACWDF1_29070 [Streptomyces coelicoflavus]|jgi:hypothetical protein|uniref:Uncharacterized protein n=1 Tax=Streptomyces albus (strain ATCC 21838 / DSM 41398 / FERM P-419 / JCM 4703 / NBRC 107858) TaxID=1081613 RepID=A0A0B5EHI0_STRA4|nr:hypothetical protein SLNWT_1277 [Streptomyces albus]AOU75969.1 hypothetical protein SLNHY_1278 [Streptomyces albus]AYN31771.1 hypothetical protein DUI70_1268 [Streptomyces albus]MCP8706816.1 hypothetical protein [Streptomyces sp. AC04842]WDI21681.1 hypothetical protein PS783_30600 [Streptomyces enissocaesilis]
MDLTGLALRAAAGRPHVLLATLPGGTAARLEAERALRLRDWPLAATPAQADVLLVVGPDRPDLHAAVARLWQDLPAPRARVHARGAEDVEAALGTGQARLSSLAGQQAEAPGGATQGGDTGSPHHQDSRCGEEQGETNGDADGSHDEHDGGGGGHHHDADAQHGDEQAGSHERHEGHEGHDGEDDHSKGHGGHGGHGGGDMEMPGGLPMAEQGEDRDGLMLDQLHVPLGPLLADWPAGLTIHVTLQGDLVQEAEVEEPLRHDTAAAEAFWVQPWLRAAGGEPVVVGEAARRRAAAHLDSLARLLSVAGWPAEAIVARRLRDDLLDGAPGVAVAPRLARLDRRVSRSRTLAWLTRGIGQVSAEVARETGVSGPAARADGDVTDRYRQWLADIRRDVGQMEQPSPMRLAVDESPRGWWRNDRPPSSALIALLPGLLNGVELAAARLIVASLDPDLDELPVVRSEVGACG